jgi:hypothetical protein
VKQRVVLLRFGMTRDRVAMASEFVVDRDRHVSNLSTENCRSVPEGRLKIGRHAILDNFQPSLRDLIMFHDLPRTNVLAYFQPSLRD